MRRKKENRYFGIFMTNVFIAFCLVCPSTALAMGNKGTKPEPKIIVAKVNGNPIYEDQLTPQVERVVRKYRKHGMQKDTSDFVKRLKEKTLDSLIGKEVLYQESRKLPVPNIAEKVDEKLKKMKDAFPTKKSFESSLKARRMTMDAMRESFRRSIYITEYLEKKGLSSPAVPEKEIKEYYKKYKGGFKREEHVKVSHILIKVDENAKPEEKDRLKKKAEEIRAKIAKGADFSKMAKEHSACGSAPKGGDLGYIKRGYMPPEFQKVAFALKKGKVSKIVQTEHGYHIITVLDNMPEGTASYREVKDFIGKYLREDLARKKIASHVEGLKKGATIEIFLN